MALTRFFPVRALACIAAAALTACAPISQAPPSRISPQAMEVLSHSPLPATLSPLQRQQWLDRVTWGASDHDAAQLQQQGLKSWLQAQLTPSLQPMPTEVQQRINALSISQQSITQIQREIAARREKA